MTPEEHVDLPQKLRDHGDYRRDSKDMLNKAAREIDDLRALVRACMSEAPTMLSEHTWLAIHTLGI